MSESPGSKLRAAWQKETIAVPGVFNALVRAAGRAARLPGRLPLRAALSASLGLPDVGLVTLTEFVDEARTITAATLAAAAVRRRHRLRRGAERRADGAAVRGGRRRPASTWKTSSCPSAAATCPASSWSSRRRWRPRCGRPAAARRDPDFVIIARTDARGVNGFDDAVRRARLYLEAGADAIFPEALENAGGVPRLRPGGAGVRCWPT